jgi:hypothetical protein
MEMSLPRKWPIPFWPTSSNFVFTSALLALSEGIGTDNAVDISLATDSNDEPGTILETFQVTGELGPAGQDNPLISVSSTLDPLLLAGDQYWLIESPPAAGNGVNWLTAGILSNSPQRATSDGSSVWLVNTIYSDEDPGAFSISANPVSSVPEPRAIFLVAAGALVASRPRRTPVPD